MSQTGEGMQSWDYLRQTCDGPSDLIEIPSEARRVFYQAMGAWIENDLWGMWMEPNSKCGHCDPQWFSVYIGQRFSALSGMYNGPSTQSPIEDQLLGALLWLDVDWGGMPSADMVNGPEEKEIHGPTDSLKFWITSQATIGKYQADFLLWFHLGTHIGGIAVECDGHAFHEKNKEQASRDKARDRAFLKAGFPVMRFSGSDIFKDPLACAAEVKEALSEVLYRVSKDGGLF